MTAFWLIVAQFPAAAIMRAASPESRRWVLARAWAGALTATFVVADLIAVHERGISKSSLALLVAAVLSVFAYLVLVLRLPVRWTVGNGELVLFLPLPALRGANVRLRQTLFVWWALMSLASLVPLRYGGFLVDEPEVSRVVGAVSLGLFAPLAERRSIDVGQCVLEHDVRAENLVVPCGSPHKTEVVAAVDRTETCPARDEFATLLMVTVDRSVEIDGLVYCVLHGVNARYAWKDKIGRKAELPATL
jgi:hypothetical protein